MLKQIIQVTLGLHEVTPIVHMVQTDTGRTLRCIVKDYLFEGTEGVALVCMRPDETVYSYSGTVDTAINSADFDLDIDGGALSQAGTVACHVIVTDTGGDVVSSFRLNIIVHEVIGGEATADDIAFLDGLQAQLTAWITDTAAAFVPSSRTVNGKVLTTDVVLDADDIPYDQNDSVKDKIDVIAGDLATAQSDLATKADKSTTINGKDLSTDRTIYAQDVPSKNLLPNTASTTTSNGVTFTVNSDGSVTVNGTASADVTFQLSDFYIADAGEYILSGCPINGSYSTYALQDSGGSFSSRDYGDGTTQTLSANSHIVPRIRIASGYTASNLTFYPQIRRSSDPEGYVPYAKTNVELSNMLLSAVGNSNVKMSVSTLAASSTNNIALESGRKYVLFIIGSSPYGTGMALVNVSSAGDVIYREVLAATQLSYATGTNQITITKGATGTSVMLMLSYKA